MFLGLCFSIVGSAYYKLWGKWFMVNDNSNSLILETTSKIKDTVTHHLDASFIDATGEATPSEKVLERALAEARAYLSTQPQLALDLCYHSESLAQSQNDTAKLNLLKASCLWRLGKVSDALSVAEDSFELDCDVVTLCSLKEIAARSQYYLGNYMDALRTASESLMIIREADGLEASEERFVALNTQGSIYYRLGQFEQALATYLESYDVANTLNDRILILKSISNISNVYQEQGRFEQAYGYLEKALSELDAIQDVRTKVIILGNFSPYYFSVGQYQEAVNYADKALSIEGGMPIDYIDIYAYKADALSELQKYAEADENFAAAKKLLAQHPNNYLFAMLYLRQAAHLVRQDKHSEAIDLLLQAKELVTKSNSKKELYQVHLKLSEIYRSLGQPEEALENYIAFHEIKTALQSETSEQRMKAMLIEHDVNSLIQEKELTARENERLEQIVLERTSQIEEAHLEMLKRLAIAGEKRDDDTGEHTDRVGTMSALIAQELGCDVSFVQMIQVAAKLHDIGKIGIPDSILLKPDKLTNEEFDTMKTHTSIGAEMLSNSDSLLIKMAERIVHCHHEKWNGRGYPNGLVGTDIPLEGRIVAIADVYDALTNVRPYKRAWTHEEAIEEIVRSSDSHFDPDVVDAFLKVIESKSI